MNKKHNPKVSFRNDTATIADVPGISIQIMNPFDDFPYELGTDGSIGRIKAPKYHLTGKEGIESLNQLLKHNRQKKSDVSSIVEIKDFNGVGAKTLMVLEQAQLSDPEKITLAGKEKLLAAGVHISVVDKLLSQAETAVEKMKKTEITKRSQDIEKFMKDVAKTTYFALELRVLVDCSKAKNIVFFSVDGKKNITKAKLQVTTSEKGPDGTIGKPLTGYYKKTIPVKEANSERFAGLYHTEMVEDTIRYAYLLPDGTIKSGDITLVSQMGEFFLSIQEIYNLETYRTKDRILIPEMEQRRPQFCKFFKEVFDWSTIKLRHINAMQPKRAFDFRTLRQGEGYIEFYSVAQRSGAMTIISPNTGKMMTVKIHWESIETDSIARLDEGDIVRYANVLPHKSNSGRASEFTHEVKNVRYLRSSKEIRYTTKQRHQHSS